MYLKSLKINGFKSFIDAGRIQLQPGVTAIVGPNGCGKSNIADAIRWVLGEQSAKSLRATTMQDVIFQGTDGRKPVNLCEVSLLFSDCEEDLGTAFNEVEITRRVARDGASDYLLNGKICRLKDIQRLFLDTGIGQVSYSFMVQGQIDQILSSNPAERRVIFEEAAGISKYKAQRREALNKLALVDANLARVTDVIEEISRQIGSLKRQAVKALRFKRMKHRLTHLDLAANARRYGELQGGMSEMEEAARGLRTEAAHLEGELESVDARLSDQRRLRGELYASMQEAQQTVYNLRSEKEQAENRAEISAIRITDLNARISEIESEITGLIERKESLVTRAEGDALSKQEQLDLVGVSDEAMRTRHERLAETDGRLEEAEEAIQGHKQDLLMAESALTRLRSECTALELDLKTYQVKHANLSEEVYRNRNDGDILEASLKDLLRARASRERDRSKEEKALSKLGTERDSLRNRFRSVQGKIQEIDRGVARRSAQISILIDLQEKLEGFSEGAKAIMQGKLKDVLEEDSVRLLTRGLRVKSGFRVAIESIMGPAIDAITVGDPSLAVAAAEVLERKKLGRACLQIPRPVGKSRGKPELPDWLIPAGDVADSRDPVLKEPLQFLLEDCYICENLETFLKFWESNSEFEFLFTATENGELVDRRGLIYGGHKAGQPNTYLQREAEIKAYQKEQKKDEASLERERLEAGKLDAELDRVEVAFEAKRERLIEISEEVSTINAQQQGGEERFETLKTWIAQTETALQTLEKERDDSIERLERSKGKLQSVEGEMESHRSTIAKAEEALRGLREERDSVREGLADVRLELAEKRQQLELIDRGLDEIRKQNEETDLLVHKRGQEKDFLHDQIKTLDGEGSEDRSRAAEIGNTLTVTTGSLEASKKKLADAEKAIQDAESSVKRQRETHHEVETKLNRHEVALARREEELRFLAEEVRREYQVELGTIDVNTEIWRSGDRLPQRVKLDLDDDASVEEKDTIERGDPTSEDLESVGEIDWVSVGEEVDYLRGRIDAMGPVNLIAIEEYRELRERYDFLKSQSDDLWAAKDQLLTAIDEINTTSQELFHDTFEQVRSNFKYTFDSLFGGGYADLELIDAEDVLESGINIIARPPGTRLKTLILLSGGQKTMTAVALLFAIYMVKPSPFCLLDELDAPLDDANIGRFVKMLTQFTKFSQFVIITHNKRTISAADVIYGVTMQEKGVSKMVSMRFDRKTGRTEELTESAVG